ncbi:spatacsin isoform X2 [Monomorium pharaonis]|uniref:spatacsin isoform X2 n=1 Tax=Monomorium pharaonis TaxID=307658 RepID=UPI0017478CB5|nr:spatacsin isoform X2 [Monomorium pharaonis]
MSEKKTVGGVPVESLTGESAAIWSGWRILGDRELVREASAKGTHIKLAYKCLAFRRNCSVEQACIYFNKEVETWVKELLNKKQIFRASHILKNMGKDPIEYIFAVSIKSKDPLLRNYLCEYMINVAGFKTEHVAAWNIIKSIKQHEEKCNIQDGLSSDICIDDIMKLPQNIEQALRTELYFSLNNPEILGNVSNNILWDYLLSNNKINALRTWIETKYNPDVPQTSDKIDPHLKSLFANLNITPDMVDCIESSSASDFVKYLTKNYLCRYGIFTKEEKNDIKLILNRFFGCGITLEELSKILSLASCNIDKTEFLQSVDEQLCLTHCSQSCHTPEDNLKLKKLYNALTDMCDARNNYEDAILHGITESIDYISDDFNGYLKTNYLVSWALIFLRLWQMRNTLCNEASSSEKNTLMRDIFTNKTVLNIDTRIIPQEVLQSALTHIPSLQSIIEDRNEINDITVYDLLDGYRNLNSKLLFKWRFKNEPMPTFTNENLIKKYGYQETLTYGYYLKEGRPNMAVHSLTCGQAKLFGNVSSHRKFKAALYAHILALKNLNKSDIVCGCIAFIELLKIDSSNLRLHVTVAKYVQEQLNISIGNLLENVVYKNQTDLQSVISYLEQSFQKYLVDINFISDSAQFVEVLKIWDIIVRFARVHNCVLPDTLLKYLADRDLWFEFISVCHIFAYPVTQVLENTKLFNNPNIREHLLTCLSNDKLSKFQPHDELKIKSHDTGQSSPRQHKVEEKKKESPESSSTISGIETDATDVINTKDNSSISISSEDNLWLIILKCHQSQDPPRALINASRSYLRPILTVLATCYEPSSVAAYCYCWMVISTEREDILLDYTECLDQQIWPSDKVSKLLNKMVQCGYINTIYRAYKIFMPDNILNPFFEFLMQAISYGEFKENQRHLIEFKSQCSSLKCNKIMDWDSVNFTYMKNLYWIAVVAIQCIVTALGYGFRSTPLRVKFLEALIKCNFSADLPAAVPDFQRLLNITKIVQKTDVTFNFKAVTLIDNAHNFDTEIQRCITDLIAIENYTVALELACCAGLNTSEIILAQYRNTFKQSINRDDQINSTFWMQCAEDFNKYDVPPQIVVEFFVEHAEKVASHKERYEILKLAYETLKNTKIEQQTIDTLEMAMWKSCILAGPDNIEFDSDNHIFNKLKTELLSGLDKLQVTCSLTDENEKNAAEILINKLIDLGKLTVALRIGTIFNYNHKGLQILMLCLSLAEGEISPADLTVQQKSLLEEKNQKKQQKYSTLFNRGLQKFSSSSSLNSISSSVEPSKTNDTTNSHLQMECISILEKLSKNLKHGNEICLRIISCYKLATRLGKTYQSLLMLKDPIKFLQEITESNIENKFETANDIIMSYKIKTENIATFLTENITTHINRAIEDGQEDLIFMWGYSLNSHFHLIMELCSDISLLGLKLLKTAQSLLARYISTHDEKKNGLKTIVELLIRSHECFTASCNMEGIASVLRKCQSLANTLHLLKHWALLVRLVTGVGRFTEMNYIFQILKENNQFESLLGQGLDKVPGLKMALLEFLKRQCPEDKELFTLVALHFRLYYEIALMWENEAKEIITKLISGILKECGKGITGIPVEIRLTRNDDVHKQLQLAITNFTHATQYYLQDKKLNLASRSSHQAQLVALQISLLNAVPQNQQAVCLLNLKTDELERILSHILNFPQALIVIRAYNYHVDWVNLIYHHCILKGDTKYLQDFLTVNTLTPMIVQDCARRYRLEKSINHSMTDNMRILISELSDVECKYMLASQLGFKDIVEEMLNDAIVGSYLKDTIWKKGYTAS